MFCQVLSTFVLYTLEPGNFLLIDEGLFKLSIKCSSFLNIFLPLSPDLNFLFTDLVLHCPCMDFTTIIIDLFVSLCLLFSKAKTVIDKP